MAKMGPKWAKMGFWELFCDFLWFFYEKWILKVFLGPFLAPFGAILGTFGHNLYGKIKCFFLKKVEIYMDFLSFFETFLNFLGKKGLFVLKNFCVFFLNFLCFFLFFLKKSEKMIKSGFLRSFWDPFWPLFGHFWDKIEKKLKKMWKIVKKWEKSGLFFHIDYGQKWPKWSQKWAKVTKNGQKWILNGVFLSFLGPFGAILGTFGHFLATFGHNLYGKIMCFFVFFCDFLWFLAEKWPKRGHNLYGNRFFHFFSKKIKKNTKNSKKKHKNS